MISCRAPPSHEPTLYKRRSAEAFYSTPPTAHRYAPPPPPPPPPPAAPPRPVYTLGLTPRMLENKPKTFPELEDVVFAIASAANTHIESARAIEGLPAAAKQVRQLRH